MNKPPVFFLLNDELKNVGSFFFLNHNGHGFAIGVLQPFLECDGTSRRRGIGRVVSVAWRDSLKLVVGAGRPVAASWALIVGTPSTEVQLSAANACA